MYIVQQYIRAILLCTIPDFICKVGSRDFPKFPEFIRKDGDSLPFFLSRKIVFKESVLFHKENMVKYFQIYREQFLSNTQN